MSGWEKRKNDALKDNNERFFSLVNRICFKNGISEEVAKEIVGTLVSSGARCPKYKPLDEVFVIRKDNNNQISIDKEKIKMTRYHSLDMSIEYNVGRNNEWFEEIQIYLSKEDAASAISAIGDNHLALMNLIRRGSAL